MISAAPALARAADSSSKWDQPFGKPMYLLRTNGGKHYDSNGEEFGTMSLQECETYTQRDNAEH